MLKGESRSPPRRQRAGVVFSLPYPRKQGALEKECDRGNQRRLQVAEVCRKTGISEATFYNWKKQYAGLGISELRELRQLREENGRLKRLVADLSLDRQILQEIVSKKL